MASINSQIITSRIEQRLAFAHASVSAMRGACLTWGHRLPDEWRQTYQHQADRITYTVYNYGTPIAWVLAGGEVVQPPVKYSRTTNTHQGIVREALARPQA